jgi:hypothetical protein
MVISFDQAKVIAEESLQAIAEAADDEFGIVDNEAIDEGWLFFYNRRTS